MSIKLMHFLCYLWFLSFCQIYNMSEIPVKSSCSHHVDSRYKQIPSQTRELDISVWSVIKREIWDIQDYIYFFLYYILQPLPQHGYIYPLWFAECQRYQSGRGTQSQFLSGGHRLSRRSEWWFFFFFCHNNFLLMNLLSNKHDQKIS